jgi:hypothetical protein
MGPTESKSSVLAVTLQCWLTSLARTGQLLVGTGSYHGGYAPGEFTATSSTRLLLTSPLDMPHVLLSHRTE